MPEAVDVGGIFTEIFLDISGIILSIPEIPAFDHIDAFAASLDGAVFPEKVKSFLQIVGIDVGRALDHAVASVAETHQRHPDVLRLNVIMGQPIRIGHDLADFVTHHPTQ